MAGEQKFWRRRSVGKPVGVAASRSVGTPSADSAIVGTTPVKFVLPSGTRQVTFDALSGAVFVRWLRPTDTDPCTPLNSAVVPAGTSTLYAPSDVTGMSVLSFTGDPVVVAYSASTVEVTLGDSVYRSLDSGGAGSPTIPLRDVCRVPFSVYQWWYVTATPDFDMQCEVQDASVPGDSMGPYYTSSTGMQTGARVRDGALLQSSGSVGHATNVPVATWHLSEIEVTDVAAMTGDKMNIYLDGAVERTNWNGGARDFKDAVYDQLVIARGANNTTDQPKDPDDYSHETFVANHSVDATGRAARRAALAAGGNPRAVLGADLICWHIGQRNMLVGEPIPAGLSDVATVPANARCTYHDTLLVQNLSVGLTATTFVIDGGDGFTRIYSPEDIEIRPAGGSWTPYAAGVYHAESIGVGQSLEIKATATPCGVNLVGARVNG